MMDELNSFFFSGAPSKDWKIISSSTTTVTTLNMTIPFPDGYQAGDAVLAFHVWDSSVVPAVPTGWSSVTSDTRSNIYLYCQILPKITSETAFPLVATSTSATRSLTLVVVRPPAGFDASTLALSVADKSNNPLTYYTNQIDVRDITTELDNNLIFMVGALGYAGTITPATGYTQLISKTTDASLMISYKYQKTAGLENPDPMTFTPADGFIIAGSSSCGIIFALRTKKYPLKLITDLTDYSTQISEVPAGGVVVAAGVQKFVTFETDGVAPVQAVITGGNATQYRLNAIDPWINAGTFTVANGDGIGLRQTSSVIAKGTSTTTTASLYFQSGSTTTNTYTYSLTTRRAWVLSESASSNSTWVVPTGVTSITAIGTGSGGDGGRANNTTSGFRGGGGGGGGALSYTETIAVTAGETLTVRVYPANTVGGNCMIWRSTTALFKAQGGLFGTSATSTAVGLGGAGGSATNGIGTVRFSGGAGGNGVVSTTLDYASGGGGGAAGYSAVGGNGALGSTTGTTRVSSAAATGGASSGGASNLGGGGTGVSGAGTAGAASSTVGREGSPDTHATDGLNSSFTYSGGDGGASGGGGGGGHLSVGGGGGGKLRVTW